MKNTTFIVVSTLVGILGLLLAVNGNIYAQNDSDDDAKTNIQEYNGKNQLKGKLIVLIHYEEDPSYYDDGLLITDNFEKKFDIGELAEKFASPFYIPYYYYGNQPVPESVCLENLNSHKKNCVDVDSGDKEIDINMPD